MRAFLVFLIIASTSTFLNAVYFNPFYWLHNHQAIGVSANVVHFEMSCTESNQQSQSLWTVELPDEIAVDSVIITNTGECCSDGIDGAEVHIGSNAEDDALCAVLSSIPAGQTAIVPCKGMKGHYVHIKLPETQSASQCQVELSGKFHSFAFK